MVRIILNKKGKKYKDILIELLKNHPKIYFKVNQFFLLENYLKYYIKNPMEILINVRYSSTSSLNNVISKKKRNCFFGYYDNSPLDYDERYLLYLSVPMINYNPSINDKATIGYLDLNNGKKFDVATTRAWNWQQGCRLKWLKNNENDPLFIYNDYRSGRYVAVLRYLKRGIKKIIPFPVYSVDYSGKKALSLNFERLHRLRPGYGYNSNDYSLKNYKPANDGIYHIDLRSDKVKLVLSIEDIAKDVGQKEDYHWINHIKFNPGGSRAVFLHRFESEGKRRTQMYTMRPDGLDLYCLCNSGFISHFAWKNDKEILAWSSSSKKKNEKHYYLFKDKTKETKIIGKEKLIEDGHPSFSPNGRWVLTDTYPDKGGWKRLILYDTIKNKKINLGKFYTPIRYMGSMRCDLHPRWDRKGEKICFDSVHDGRRKLYVIDIKSLKKEI